MPPKKCKGKDPINKNQTIQKSICKKKNNMKNPPIIKIEIPSKVDTTNLKDRVVTAPYLISHAQLAKNKISDTISPTTKLVLRHRCINKKQPKEENVNTQMKTTAAELSVQKPCDEENPKRPLAAATTRAKPPVKRKSSTRKQLNKTSHDLNETQPDEIKAIGSDDTNAAKRPCSPKRRRKRSTSKSKKTSAPRNKRIEKGKKGKNDVIQTTNSTPSPELPRKVKESKDQPLSIEITIDGRKLEQSKVSGRESTSSECMSWTRDISSSSTTTCFTVHTNDIVRFDNKLPVVKLSNIAGKPCADGAVNDATYEEQTKQLTNKARDTSRPPSSSPSPDSSSDSNSDEDTASSDGSAAGDKDLNQFDKILSRLTTKLKNFDIEIMNWLGYNGNEAVPAADSVGEKFYSSLKEESEIIAYCRNIKKVILGDGADLSVSRNVEADVRADMPNVDFVKPDAVVKNNVSAAPNSADDDEGSAGRFVETAKNPSNVTDDDMCNDDEDALSLFAESISGFESIRKNTSHVNAPNHDEYIPQSVCENTIKTNDTVKYLPTQINRELENRTDVNNKSARIVCEKQNADSTSIQRDFKSNDNKSSDDSIHLQVLSEQQTKSPQNFVISNTDYAKPGSIAFFYKATNVHSTVAFAGVCFFNLAYTCTKFNCNYIHSPLDADVVKARLKSLKDHAFIQEYMLMRQSTLLRRQYGLIFVSDCIRRNLTAIILEMAIDFTTKSCTKDDRELRVDVIEAILLHLNTVDVSAYGDFLLFVTQHGTALCDCFMHAIAETQNFTRFKRIFISLTNFFCEFHREVKCDVATSLLVRLSILPYEEPIARALLKIIKRTSRDILGNSMIIHLEDQLSSENPELYEELQMLKRGGPRQTFNGNPIKNATNDYEFNHVNVNPSTHMEIDKRCSPDTTKLDFMNNAKPTQSVIFKHQVIPRTSSDKTFSMVFSNNGRSFKHAEQKSGNDAFVFNSSAGAAQLPRFQGRPAFTANVNKHRFINGNRPTNYPGRFAQNMKRL